MLPEFEIPLNICGLPTTRNRGALAWSSSGLAAVGSGTDILVIDAETLSPVQVISTDHKSSINRVVWNPYARQITEGKQSKYHADLLSTDTLNNICVWDAEKSQLLSTFNHPEGKQLLDMKWCDGPDAWKRNKVYLLYAGNHLVVYDVLNHHQSQNYQLSEPQGVDLTSFDIDPFSPSVSTSLALLGEGFIAMATFDPHKNDKITVTANIVLKVGMNPPNGSPLAQPTPTYTDVPPAAQPILQSIGKRSSSSSSSIRKLVSDIIVGPENPLNQVIVRFGTLEYLHSMKDHLVVWTSRDIYLINTYFCVVLNVFSLERSASNIISLIPCKRRPCFFTLHENGTLFLRKYSINNLSHSHNMTVTLDQLSVSENPRLSSKKSEVLGGALEPTNHENKLLIYLSDGRFVTYSLCFTNSSKKAINRRLDRPSKLLPTPVTPGACDFFVCAPPSGQEAQQEPSSDKNCPPDSIAAFVKGILESSEANNAEPGHCNLKLKLRRATVSTGQITCLKSLKQGILVGGTSTGYALVIRCGSGGNAETNRAAAKIPKLVKKFAVHSNSPVSGMEVVSETEVLTWTNLSFSANPKCELCLTEITCGSTKILKQDEPSHIGSVRVSPLGQYFIIVYKNGAAPAELWDLPRRQLIKVLPSKMPPITCVQWRQPIEGSREETFYMTDLGTFLFTLRVDGNRFSNATCATLDTGTMGGIPVALFTRGNLVYRADSSGTLVKYNTDKKAASFGVSLGRGPLFKILEFGDYFVAQFSDQVELWDLNTIQKLRQLHSNKLKSTDIALVNNELLAVLVKNTGGLKFLPLHTASASAGDWYPTIRRDSGLVNEYPNFWTNREKFRYILDFLQDSTKKTCELHALALKLNFEPDEIKLWSILDAVALANGDDIAVDPDLFSGGKIYKEILVRIAQCVWLIDPKKREDVARTLILAGENEKSAEILLDTEPSDAKNYIANGLKAAISVGCNSIPEATKAVLKIIATNLIASGKNEDGLELLCMLYKHSEACKYIESTNDWDKALLLCKTTLSEPPINVQGKETISRYAQYLNNSRYILKAASLFVYIRKFDRAVEVLFGARRKHVAYLLLTICEANNLPVPVSDHVKLAIKLDFARFLFDIGLRREAISFCESLGPEGVDVKAELEILSS